MGGRFCPLSWESFHRAARCSKPPVGLAWVGPVELRPLSPPAQPEALVQYSINSPSSSRARRSASPDITGRRDARRAEESRERQQLGEAMPQAPGWNLLPRTCSSLDFSPSVICAAAQCDCNRRSKRWGPIPECERGHVEMRNPVPSHRGVTPSGAPHCHPGGTEPHCRAFPVGLFPQIHNTSLFPEFDA